MARGPNDDDWSRDADRAGRDGSTSGGRSTGPRERGQIANAALILVLLAVVCWLGALGYHLYFDQAR
jgi:hypothetical protein